MKEIHLPKKNLVPQIAPQLSQEHWEYSIKVMMKELGWTLDRDDETTLGFSFHEGEFHWVRNYNKESRRCVQYNQKLITKLFKSLRTKKNISEKQELKSLMGLSPNQRMINGLKELGWKFEEVD